MTELPLFPLKTVLLPGNQLALKIFEPRYLDMVARCMRETSCFGVVLIHQGEETSSDADIYSIGTTATISDWEHRDDGLLGITALGVDRFEVRRTRKHANGLTVADVEILSEPQPSDIPEQFSYIRELLEHINAQAGMRQAGEQDFSSTLYQLIYLLPIDNQLKQRLLEMPDCNDRAAVLHAELIRLGVIQYVKPDKVQSQR